MLSFRTNGKVECIGMSIQQPNPVGNHCFFNARACFCVWCGHMVSTDVSHNFRHLGNFQRRCDTNNTASWLCNILKNLPQNWILNIAFCCHRCFSPQGRVAFCSGSREVVGFPPQLNRRHTWQEWSHNFLFCSDPHPCASCHIRRTSMSSVESDR